MQVLMNTVSPKYNAYNNFNNTNKQQFNRQPSFGANTDEVVIKVVKKSNFLKKTIDTCKAVPKKLTQASAWLVPKLFDNKLMDNLSVKLQNSDNLFKHFLAIGSAITSGMYMYKTLQNDKLDKDRKNTLAVNQFLTFVLSTAGAYALDGSINDWWQKMTAKYAAASLEDKTILTDFVKEFKEAKEENKKIKAFNKTAAAADKKDLKSVRADAFIKERLGNYLVDAADRKAFMDRIKGMSFLKSMLVFALVYRYIVPVAVTKPANILCEKYLAHKKNEEKDDD